MGAMYLGTSLVMGLLQRFPALGRWCPIFGLLIMCMSLALSSFSTTVTQLTVTQGFLYRRGASIAYSPCITYADEWPVRCKGFTYGLMCVTSFVFLTPCSSGVPLVKKRKKKRTGMADSFE